MAYFAKDSNRIGAVFGGVGLALAGLVFFWFLSNLRLAAEGPGPLPGVVTAAGTTFVVLLLTGTAALVAVPYARTFGGAYGEDAILVGTEALLPQMGYVLLAVLAMWSAVAVTISGRAHDGFPRWLVRLGFATSVLVFVFGSSVMGVLGVPVWALAVGIHWLKRRSAVGGEVKLPSCRTCVVTPGRWASARTDAPERLPERRPGIRVVGSLRLEVAVLARRTWRRRRRRGSDPPTAECGRRRDR